MKQLATERGVVGKLPVTSNTIWAWVRKGIFPAPVKLGGRTTVWKIEDVDAWLAAKESA